MESVLNMKQIGIITHYDVHNHGALLQLTAMIKVLGKKGFIAKALRFDKNYDFMGYSLKAKYNPSIKSVGIYLNFLKEKGLGCTFYNYKKHRTLNRYKHEENLIGDFYSEINELDGVIVGSDEVFALHTGPTPVFFGHCLPSDHIFSYAGSFGPTTYADILKLHSEAFVKSGIAAMEYVTVRDTNSAEVVKELIGNKPPIVVDPVLLYGYEEEIKHLTPPKLPDYLLVYAYDNRMNSPEEVEAIRNYARSKNLKIVSSGFYHSWCDYNIDTDPITLLKYFKYAKEVVTDTFHGSVMSLITGADFAVKTRDSNHLKLVNLLKEYGLTGRIFRTWENMPDILLHKIDYTKVNPEIVRRRAESMKHLDEMLTKIK